MGAEIIILAPAGLTGLTVNAYTSVGGVRELGITLTELIGGVYAGNCVTIQVGDLLRVLHNGIYWFGGEYQASAVDIAFIRNVIEGDVNTYYVYKDGDDANSGLTRAEALLTINQALTNSSDGDSIVVGPGTFTESLWLSGLKRKISGAGPGFTILTNSSVVVTLGSDCVLENMSVIGVNTQGIEGFGKSNFKLDNLIVSGFADGVLLQNCTDFVFKNLNVTGEYDGVALNSVERFFLDHVVARTTATYSAVSATWCRGLQISAGVSGILRDCVCIADDEGGVGGITPVISGLGILAGSVELLLDNVVCKSISNGNASSSRGVYVSDTAIPSLVFSNCVVSGDNYSFYLDNLSGQVVVSGTLYNSATVHGILVQVGTGWLSAVEAACGVSVTAAHAVTDALIAALATSAELVGVSSQVAVVDGIVDYIQKIVESDSEIDKSGSPWVLKILEKGTSNVLLQKELYKLDGTALDSTHDVVGQHKEV